MSEPNIRKAGNETNFATLRALVGMIGQKTWPAVRKYPFTPIRVRQLAIKTTARGFTCRAIS